MNGEIFMYILQGVTSVAMAFGMFILSGIKDDIKSINRKLDSSQTKEACKLAHEGHDKIHDMEREQAEKENERLQRDINNVATMARSVITPAKHTRYQE